VLISTTLAQLLDTPLHHDAAHAGRL